MSPKKFVNKDADSPLPRAAVEEGIVVGGGTALLRCIPAAESIIQYSDGKLLTKDILCCCLTPTDRVFNINREL